MLIYGRTEETKNSQSRANRKAALAYEVEKIMTYDRLMPSHDQSFYFCGKITSQKYLMISFPEYLQLSPGFAEDVYGFDGKIEAIQNNDKISEERKKFLIERINYWMPWVETGAKEIIRLTDEE